MSDEIELSYSMLSMCGVPRERARTVANGINVLATRYSKERESYEAEITRLRAELEGARKAAARYEIVRRFNVQQFADVFKLNITTGKPFDQIIDDLSPFYDAAISREKGEEHG